MSTICLATSRLYPAGNDDITVLQQAFHASGLTTTLMPWQDINIGGNELVLPLAVWDYSQLFLDYKRFLTLMENSKTPMLNSVKLQHWNVEKTYLQALENQGIMTVPSLHLSADFPMRWKELYESCSCWENPVIKPVIGQSGYGVRRLDTEPPTLQEYPHGALLQPYLNSITTDGEMCLIYINGEYSHAIRRTPNDWRANSTYGVTITPITAELDWQQSAEKALKFITQEFGETPLYARIDGLLANDGQWHISEVELIEPALYLQHDSQATERFIDAVKQRLSAR